MKYKIRKTGEMVDVISYSAPMGTRRTEDDYVSFVDSNGDEHPREKGNIYWDFEQVANDINVGSKVEIDWEQRRYETSRTMLAELWSSGDFNGMRIKAVEAAVWAVSYADALIAELKKGGDQ